MRSLTSFCRRAEQRDEGAVLVLVASMMVVLLGIGAMVVDFGALAVEKREVQNGTDAAALAVAQSCAAGSCGTPATMANTYLGFNAEEDANTVLETVCGVGPGLSACADPAPAGAAGALGWVRVRANAPVAYAFGPVMNQLGGNARATSVVAWGGLRSTSATPLTFSLCEFQRMGGNISTGVFPSGSTTIYFHGIGGRTEAGVTPCTAQTSGADLPGGFGWLATSSGCSTPVITSGAWVAAGTGVSVPNGCNLSALVNQELLIAVFDAERGTGANGEYRIVGFVGFRITAYRFPGNVNPNGFRCTAGTGNSASCLQGTFTRMTDTGGGLGGPNLGAMAVQFVG